MMRIPFQLRSFTSSFPSGAFFRSHFWLLYGFRIGSRGLSSSSSIAQATAGVELGRRLMERALQFRRQLSEGPPWQFR